jgi:IS30 family transposase
MIRIFHSEAAMGKVTALLPREKEEICRRAKSGETIREIAASFMVSESTISKFLHERGFARRHRTGQSRARQWMGSDQQRLEEMMSRGMTSEEIAFAMDRPAATIRRKMSETRKRREGVTDYEIGKKYRLLQRQLRKLGVEDEMRCRYEGACQGYRVKHHLFRSVSGGYLIAISDRQIDDYEIREAGK